MDTEANSMATKDVKERLKKKVVAYRQDLDNMTNDFERANNTSISSSKINATDRSALLGGVQDDFESIARDNRGRLAESQVALERSDNSLMRSLALMEETESIGVESAQNLRQQGDQIRRTHQRVSHFYIF